MTGNLVTIVKDDRLVDTDEDSLRRGDVVALQAAELVPADLKLVEAQGLEVDEFDITGELLPVAKEVEDEDVFLYAGSKITKGIGKGIVLATGEQTEYGKVFKEESERKPSYQFLLIEKKYLGLVLLLLPAFVIQFIQSKNAIGVIALYSILSVILLVLQNTAFFKHILVSYEVQRLENSKIQIRDTRAFERMSSIDTLCFDKTGVLTTRQMEVKNVFFSDRRIVVDSMSTINRNAFHWLQMACALGHDVLFWEKLDQANAIDKALVAFAQKSGIDVQELLQQHKRIYEKPFDSEHRYMVSGFEVNGREVYFAKGAPEVIQNICRSYLPTTGGRKKTGSEFWHSNRLNLEAINQSGGTIIALAYSESSSTDFTFLCLLQLENPLQAGVRAIIDELMEKNIRSILLTGDRAETAVRVAEECGIAREPTAYLVGRTLDRMETQEIARQSAYCSVFARLLPSQKGFLVRILQQDGGCVGMIGDGINDGIALKAADVGISFAENSSAVARRLAKILIGDLTDLSKLLESAHRVKRRIGQAKTFRILIITVSLLGVYIWPFLLHILGG
jgi:Ca2+-transporting ATPase